MTTHNELFIRITTKDKKGKIKQDMYAVTRSAPIPGYTRGAWNFYKELPADGPDRPHTVTWNDNGMLTCDCQAYTMGRTIPCKHITALVDLGQTQDQSHENDLPHCGA